MTLPLNIQREAARVSRGDQTRQRFFLMGAAYAISGQYGDTSPDDAPYPLQQALDTWLRYKAEKNQRYKPLGLRSLKKKLMQLSAGDPGYAMQIVEFSMANNYSGIFAPKNSQYERDKSVLDKLGAILAD